MAVPPLLFIELAFLAVFKVLTKMSHDSFDDFCWNTAHDGSGRDILGDDGTGGHDGALADGDTRQDGDIGPEPHFVPDVDGMELHVASTVGILGMIDGAQGGIVANQAVVTDDDTALVLELAPRIDERAFTHHRVLAEVGVERREHAHALGHLKAPQL